MLLIILSIMEVIGAIFFCFLMVFIIIIIKFAIAEKTNTTIVGKFGNTAYTPSVVVKQREENEKIDKNVNRMSSIMREYNVIRAIQKKLEGIVITDAHRSAAAKYGLTEEDLINWVLPKSTTDETQKFDTIEPIETLKLSFQVEDIKKSIEVLKKLKTDGVISKEEYNKRFLKIIDDASAS